MGFLKLRNVALFALACAVLAVACKNLPCSKLQTYTDKAAVAIAAPAVLDCEGVSVMQRDIINYCEQKGYCKQGLNGPIALVVCPFVVPYIVSFGVGKLPPEWKCKGTGAEAAIMAACNAVPF